MIYASSMICCYIFLLFVPVKMLPIDNLFEDQVSPEIYTLDEVATSPKIIVKRSIYNGLELLKTFSEYQRKYHCQINFNVANGINLTSLFLIEDDTSKFNVTNFKSNNNAVIMNGSILTSTLNYTGDLKRLIFEYDFVPNNMVDLETRIVTVSINRSNPILSESSCLQRANFSASVNTNLSLIILFFFALILVVIIFCIIWPLICHRHYSRETSEQDNVNSKDIYVEELNLLTSNSSKTYYETDTRTKTVPHRVDEFIILETDFSNAREMDEQLQLDFGKINDIVFTIWLNSIAEQWPGLRDKLSQIAKQRNGDKDNIIRMYQTVLSEKFKEIKNNIIEINNVNLAELKKKQEEERKRIMELVTVEDRNEVSDNLEKLFESEKRNVAIQLKVEQEKAFEDVKVKCHSEIMESISSKQIDYVKALIKQAQLGPDDCEAIIKTYAEWQQKLQTVQENEKIRQAAAMAYLLENKINQSKKMNDENKGISELFEKKIEYFSNAITEFEENGDISPEACSKILNQFESDKEQILSDMEKSKGNQIKALTDRLDEAKRKKLEDLKVKQGNETNNLMTVHATDTEAQNLINELVALKVEHRDEYAMAEAFADENCATQLASLLQEIGVQTLNKLDEKISGVSKELRYSGFSESDIEDILDDSNKRMKRIQKSQREEREKQEKVLQERLQKIKKEIDENAHRQSKDQTNILVAQFEVMNEITGMQRTLSVDERNQIMELFAKNKSSTQSNLVNSRILQKRKMEEALNSRKEEKMKKLEQEHNEKLKEIYEKGSRKKNKQSLEDDVSKCVSEYVANKLNIINHEDSQKDIDQEMERIRKEILEERVLLIHRKEEEIVALLNKFQMAKATEQIEIKEQQDKIMELQMVVLDTLDKDKNVNSVLAKHNREKEVLADKIDMNKRRQEDDLQKRLMKKKNRNLLAVESPDAVDNGIVNHSKKQNLENEILQNNLKSENEIKQFETEFLKKITESGNFPRSDLVVLLRDKFPMKTNQEIETIAEEIYPKSQEKSQPQTSLIKSYKKISEQDKSKYNPSLETSSRAQSRQRPASFDDPPSSSKRPSLGNNQQNFAVRSMSDEMADDVPVNVRPKKKKKKHREIVEETDKDEISI